MLIKMWTVGRWIAATSLFASSFALADDHGATSELANANQVVIERDDWGVPHVSAPTDAGAVFGYMYAQAQDNFWQIEDTAIQALRRYAKVVGDAGLGADYLNRALGLAAKSRAE